MINIHPSQALILLNHMNYLHQARCEYLESVGDPDYQVRRDHIKKEVITYCKVHHLPRTNEIDDLATGEYVDMILDKLSDTNHLAARDHIGEPERISSALACADRYIEVYGMTKGNEQDDRLTDRFSGDGEPDYYDFMVRSLELNEDEIFFEVEDVPAHLWSEVEELLCGFYQCDSSNANN